MYNSECHISPLFTGYLSEVLTPFLFSNWVHDRFGQPAPLPEESHPKRLINITNQPSARLTAWNSFAFYPAGFDFRSYPLENLFIESDPLSSFLHKPTDLSVGIFQEESGSDSWTPSFNHPFRSDGCSAVWNDNHTISYSAAYLNMSKSD